MWHSQHVQCLFELSFVHFFPIGQAFPVVPNSNLQTIKTSNIRIPKNYLKDEIKITIIADVQLGEEEETKSGEEK